MNGQSWAWAMKIASRLTCGYGAGRRLTFAVALALSIVTHLVFSLKMTKIVMQTILSINPSLDSDTKKRKVYKDYNTTVKTVKYHKYKRQVPKKPKQ